MPSNRHLRVGELICQELSQYMHTRHQAETVAITLTGSQVSPDARYATIYFSVVGGEEQKATAREWLESHSGELRQRIARQIRLRWTPELRFAEDTSADRANRIEAIFHELDEAERRRQPPGGTR